MMCESNMVSCNEPDSCKKVLRRCRPSLDMKASYDNDISSKYHAWCGIVRSTSKTNLCEDPGDLNMPMPPDFRQTFYTPVR